MKVDRTPGFEPDALKRPFHGAAPAISGVRSIQARSPVLRWTYARCCEQRTGPESWKRGPDSNRRQMPGYEPGVLSHFTTPQQNRIIPQNSRGPGNPTTLGTRMPKRKAASRLPRALREGLGRRFGQSDPGVSHLFATGITRSPAFVSTRNRFVVQALLEKPCRVPGDEDTRQVITRSKHDAEATRRPRIYRLAHANMMFRPDPSSPLPSNTKTPGAGTRLHYRA